MTQSTPLQSAGSHVIAGIPPRATAQLLQVLHSCPRVDAIWLYGSRAMERQAPGSDIDVCLEGPELSHGDRLRLMGEIDDLLLPWSIDLSLCSELPDDLAAHVGRVGHCIWRR